MPLDLSSLIDRLTDSQTTTLLRLAADDNDVEARVAECERRLTSLNSEASADGALDSACMPTTTVVELRELKEKGKRLAAGAADPDDRDAARLLYYLSIAAALAVHGQDISTLSLSERRKTFDELAALFSGHRIGDIFDQACAAIPPGV